jgi:hypothetical protein
MFSPERAHIFWEEEKNISSRSFKLFGDFILTVALKKK